MKTTLCLTGFSLVVLLHFSACKNDEGFNLFSVEDDIELGMQLKTEIESNPAEFPLLSETQYSAAYAHLFRMKDSILNSGQVTYKNDFAWELKIVHDDSVLNAFCAPGGYIYVYTGLIKFLDTEDQLAGVLGHEIAHADKRHSTEQLTKNHGLATLLQIVLGDNAAALQQIAAGLISLSFSRAHETEADEYSVKYLCPTEYNAAGAAGFFEKLIALQQTGSTPQFLSTHPNPDNRVENINANRTNSGCGGTGTFESRYQQLKNSLP